MTKEKTNIELENVPKLLTGPVYTLHVQQDLIFWHIV